MAGDIIDTLSAAKDAILELRGLVTDAHSATKDLKAAIKEFRELRKDPDITRLVQATIGAILTQELKVMGDEMLKTQQKIEKRIGDRVNELVNLQLYGKAHPGLREKNLFELMAAKKDELEQSLRVVLELIEWSAEVRPKVDKLLRANRL